MVLKYIVEEENEMMWVSFSYVSINVISQCYRQFKLHNQIR